MGLCGIEGVCFTMEKKRKARGAAGARDAAAAVGGDEGAPAATTGAGADIAAEVAVLDELLEEWKRRALKGDGEAVDRVLAIQRQRATLLQTWPSGGVRVSAGPGAKGMGGRGDEKEVRVVIEYVDDWRQAGRERGE
jgi:hypothetical protein